MVSSGRSSSPPAHWMSLPISSVAGAATRLLEWIRQAEQDPPKPMRGFAGSLRQDHGAVPEWRDLPGRRAEGGGRGAARGRAVALGRRCRGRSWNMS
ncbi:hypothetical protein BX281_10382 [Streptomyces sp. Ag82_O1-15]|nr:hypothetical protein BX281_10382 [Streptomyces sp. Ag82_O1-15]